MSEKKEQKYMVGSEGGVDYLMVAVKGGVALGVKALIAPIGPTGTIIGMRIRSAPYIGDGDETPSVVPISQQQGEAGLTASWPDITFIKADEVRASVEIGQVINIPIFQVEDLKKCIKPLRVFRHLVEWLERRVPGEYVMVSRENVILHFEKQVNELFEGTFATTDEEPICHGPVQSFKQIADHLQQTGQLDKGDNKPKGAKLKLVGHSKAKKLSAMLEGAKKKAKQKIEQTAGELEEAAKGVAEGVTEEAGKLLVKKETTKSEEKPSAVVVPLKLGKKKKAPAKPKTVKGDDDGPKSA